MSRSIITWCVLIFPFTLFLSACSSRSTQITEIVAEIMARGEVVPFEVCAEAPLWVRPSEEEQTSIWELDRYVGTEEEVLKHPWTHNFFVVYGHAVLEYDLTNLSGLWALPNGARAACYEPERHDATLKLQKAEIWVLLFTVREIRRVGSSYVIIVEPVEQGVQFVQFPRPSQQLPLDLHFVTQDGRVIEEIIEAEYR